MNFFKETEESLEPARQEIAEQLKQLKTDLNTKKEPVLLSYALRLIEIAEQLGLVVGEDVKAEVNEKRAYHNKILRRELIVPLSFGLLPYSTRWTADKMYFKAEMSLLATIFGFKSTPSYGITPRFLFE